jgi:hypothetical protein
MYKRFCNQNLEVLKFVMLPTANRGSQEFSEFIFVEFSIYSFLKKKKTYGSIFTTKKKMKKQKEKKLKKAETWDTNVGKF